MYYTMLGADLQRNDLFYMDSLARSLKLDIDTAMSEGAAKYTASRQALINDKYNLLFDAYTKLKAILDTDPGRKTASANQSIMDSINASMDSIVTNVPALSAWTAVQEAAPVRIAPYRPGIPFVSFPVAPGGWALSPDASLTSKLLTPASTFVTKESYAAAQASSTASAGKGKVPMGLVIGGIAAAAALFLLNK
jgi:hypothetical protein